MRILATFVAMLAGCSGLFSPGPPAVSPEDFACPSGTTSEPKALAPFRVMADTEILLCLDPGGAPMGLQLEHWGEAIAVEGLWVEGKRDGVWTTWWPDGAFRSQVTFRDGLEQGPHLEVGRDGRLLELEMVDGLAVSWKTKPKGSPMPERVGGKRKEGTLYETRVQKQALAPEP